MRKINMELVPRLSGIYVIRNMKNNKVYIGASTHIYQRLQMHHTNIKKYIQPPGNIADDLRFWGPEAFEMYILEFCSLDVVWERENYYMDKYKSLDKSFGYNKNRNVTKIHKQIIQTS